MKERLIIASILVILCGCARIKTDFAPLEMNAKETGVASSIQLTTGDLDRSYRELGIIFLRGRHVKYEKVMKELRIKAKELGADAVIKIDCGRRYGYSRRPRCSGVAVAFE